MSKSKTFTNDKGTIIRELLAITAQQRSVVYLNIAHSLTIEVRSALYRATKGAYSTPMLLAANQLLHQLIGDALNETEVSTPMKRTPADVVEMLAEYEEKLPGFNLYDAYARTLGRISKTA